MSANEVIPSGSDPSSENDGSVDQSTLARAVLDLENRKLDVEVRGIEASREEENH